MYSAENIAIGVLIVGLVFVWVRCHSIKVYRFYRPTCGFCVSSQAEWDKFSSDCLLKMVRPININLDKPGNENLAKSFNVTGVPTIIKVKPDGSSETYSGERTAVAIMAWVRV
jgi:hypothetical protein